MNKNRFCIHRVIIIWLIFLSQFWSIWLISQCGEVAEICGLAHFERFIISKNWWKKEKNWFTIHRAIIIWLIILSQIWSIWLVSQWGKIIEICGSAYFTSGRPLKKTYTCFSQDSFDSRLKMAIFLIFTHSYTYKQ